jgi:hypothetical protein
VELLTALLDGVDKFASASRRYTQRRTNPPRRSHRPSSAMSMAPLGRVNYQYSRFDFQLIVVR